MYVFHSLVQVPILRTVLFNFFQISIVKTLTKPLAGVISPVIASKHKVHMPVHASFK